MVSLVLSPCFFLFPYKPHALLRTIIIVAFAILVVNLFHLTVIRHSFYQDQALENRQDRFRVKAPRGRIYDRDGNLLVANLYIADIIVPRKCLTPAMPVPLTGKVRGFRVWNTSRSIAQVSSMMATYWGSR